MTAAELLLPPPEAEAALGALVCRFRVDERVSLADIQECTGLGLRHASRLRRWAAAAGRWPYRDPIAPGQSRRPRQPGTWLSLTAAVDPRLADR